MSTNYKALCIELLKEWDNAPTPSDIIDTDAYGVIRKIRTALETEETMTDNHPIRPPHELVQQWVSLACENEGYETWQDLATQAARWGADQQLEQDAKWLDKNALFTQNLTISPSGDALRQAMRPKTSSSIKEEALDALDELYCSFELPPGCYSSILKALEQLDD